MVSRNPRCSLQREANWLNPAFNWQQTSIDSADQCGVVFFGLIGVAPRERAQRLVNPAGTPQVTGNHRGAACPGVPLGQKLTHHSGVVSQRGRIDRL